MALPMAWCGFLLANFYLKTLYVYGLIGLHVFVVMLVIAFVCIFPSRYFKQLVGWPADNDFDVDVELLSNRNVMFVDFDRPPGPAVANHDTVFRLMNSNCSQRIPEFQPDVVILTDLRIIMKNDDTKMADVKDRVDIRR